MTPNSDSNRGVTADLVKTRRSSSNAVEVNPDDLSININKAYVESHKKKSTLSKFIKAISRKGVNNCNITCYISWEKSRRLINLLDITTF